MKQKLFAFFAGLALSCGAAVFAASVGGNTGGVQYVQGFTGMTAVKTTSGGTGASADQVQGTAADNAAAVGNPVQIGGVDGTGKAQAIAVDANGAVAPTTLTGVTLADGTANSALSIPANSAGGFVANIDFGYNYNGTSFDLRRGTAAGGTWVQGPSAHAAAIAGNPVRLGGRARTSAFTAVSNDQTVDWAFSTAGVPYLTQIITGADSINNGVLSSLMYPGASGVNAPLLEAGHCFNGTSWDRCRTIVGGGSAGTGVTAVANNPTSNANNGIAPAASSAAESNHVFKASAGNLYWLTLTTGASAGYLMIFNATSAPVDGAVTPAYCVQVAAQSSTPLNWLSVPMVFSTGITAVFSTTGCFSKTASATAYFSAGSL